MSLITLHKQANTCGVALIEVKHKLRTVAEETMQIACHGEQDLS